MDNYPFMEPFENYLLATRKILSVPYYSQGDTDWCVPTSMSMIFKYYGQNVHSWDIAKDWRWGRRVPWWRLTLPWKVSNYFKTRGLTTEIFYVYPGHRPSFDLIKGWIDRGMPISVSVHSIKHAVVIIGYAFSDGSKMVYINDPGGKLAGEELKLGSVPYISVQVDWSIFAKYVDTFSYLIAVKGSPLPPKGTIDLQDYGFYFAYPEKPDFAQVYIWLYGHNKGLIWKYFPKHPSVLSSKDYFKFKEYVANHMEDWQNYGLKIEFVDSTTSSHVTSIRITMSVEGYSYNTNTMDLVPLSTILKERGEYKIMLILWDENFTEKYDEITLPSIKFIP